jgi:hypothetical protein
MAKRRITGADNIIAHYVKNMRIVDGDASAEVLDRSLQVWLPKVKTGRFTSSNRRENLND